MKKLAQSIENKFIMSKERQIHDWQGWTLNTEGFLESRNDYELEKWHMT